MKAPRFSGLIFLCAGLGLTGCAGAYPFSRHVSQCSEAGYTPTTQAFAQCMSRRAVALVEPADERRERLRWEARLERERLAAEEVELKAMLESEKKAERDARYAARKARKVERKGAIDRYR